MLRSFCLWASKLLPMGSILKPTQCREGALAIKGAANVEISSQLPLLMGVQCHHHHGIYSVCDLQASRAEFRTASGLTAERETAEELLPECSEFSRVGVTFALPIILDSQAPLYSELCYARFGKANNNRPLLPKSRS